MAWGFDTKAQGTESSGDPVTLAYTCGSNAKLLVVIISNEEGQSYRGGTVTYNGINMVQSYRNSIVGCGDCNVELWFLMNPPTGSSYTISVPNTAPGGGWAIVIDAMSFTCDKDFEFIDSIATAFGSTADPSGTITTGADNVLVVSAIAHNYRSPPTAGSGYTLGYSYDFGNWCTADEYDLDAGSKGSITFSYVCSADTWGMQAASFKEVDSIPFTTPTINQELSCLVRTSTGNLYYIYGSSSDGGNLVVYKSTDEGENWSSVRSVAWSTVFSYPYGAGYLDWAIDSQDYIHFIALVKYSDPPYIVRYNKFNTSTDNWGTWETLVTGPLTSQPTPKVGISIDENDKPHVIYSQYLSGGPYITTWYRNKISGSWSTAVKLADGARYASIVCHGGVVSFAWSQYASPYNLKTRDYHPDTDTWDDEVDLGSGYGYIMSCKRPFAVMSNGDTFVISDINNGAAYENAVSLGISIYDQEYAFVILDDVKYLFYLDYATRRLRLLKDSGSGWSSPIDLEGGNLYMPVMTMSAYNFHNYDGSYVYYLFTTPYSGVNYLGVYTIPIAKGSIPAYTTGIVYDYRSSIHAFLGGGGNDALIAMAYFVIPSLTGTPKASNKSAFLEGAYPSSLSSISAFTEGTTRSSKPAYTLGGNIIDDSIHSYLAGGVIVNSSIHGYMSAIGIGTSQVHAYTRSVVKWIVTPWQLVKSSTPCYLEGTT